MREKNQTDLDSMLAEDPFGRAVVAVLRDAQHDRTAECETFAPFLSAFAHGRKLPSTEALNAVTLHLAFCTHCRAVMSREKAVARRASLLEWLRHAMDRFFARTAQAHAATASKTLSAVLLDASGNQTDRRIPVEILEPPLIDSGGGFHLILKVPAEFHDAALTVFISDGKERRVLEGITTTVDEEGYVIVAGEDFGGRLEIPPEMLELRLQPRE